MGKAEVFEEKSSRARGKQSMVTVGVVTHWWQLSSQLYTCVMSHY
jgi:hypothetical protein